MKIPVEVWKTLPNKVMVKLPPDFDPSRIKTWVSKPKIWIPKPGEWVWIEIPDEVRTQIPPEINPVLPEEMPGLQSEQS